MYRFSISRCLLILLALPLLGVSQDQPAAAAKSDKANCWLRDANSPAASTAYLLCEQGQIWVTLDAGKSWTQRLTGATGRLRAFSWVDANRGIAIGDSGMVLATTDAGKTWQPRESGVKEHLMDIIFVGEQGWIAGYRGVLLHSSDGGKTWARQPAPTTMTLEGVFFVDQDRGWAVGWSGTILRTVDGGQNWKVAEAASVQWTLNALYFRNDKEGWIAGFAGQIAHTKDGGVTWTTQTSPVKNTLSSITFDAANHGWITYDDGFLVSEDGGETWKQQTVAGRFFLSKMLPIDKKLWAVGQSSVLEQGVTGKDWKKIDSLVAGRTLNLGNKDVKQR